MFSQIGGTLATEVTSAAPVDATAPVVDQAAPTEGTNNGVQADARSAPESQEGQQAPLSLKDRLAGLGFSDVSDDNEAAERLLAAYQQQQEQQARMQEQVNLIRMQMQLAQQQTQHAQPANPQAAQQKPWNPPAVDLSLVQRYLTHDADGNETWKPDTPLELRMGHEQYQSYVRNWVDKLARNPDEALRPWLEQAKQEAIAEAKKLMEQELQGKEAQTFIQSSIDQNATWLFEKDPMSNGPRVDPLTGEKVWSQSGARFSQCFDEAKDYGIQDDRKAWKVAMDLYTARYGSPRHDAVKAQINQNRLEHIQKGNGTQIAPRDGQAVPTPSRRNPVASRPGINFVNLLGLT